MSGMGNLKNRKSPEKEHKHDHGHSHGHDHGHSHGHVHGHHHHHHEETNINIRAAVVHVIGDMIQSIGVIIAATIIHFFYSETNKDILIIDPVCTYLFSIIVLFTTFPIFRDCLNVLMESTPHSIDIEALREDIIKLVEVQKVDDIHCWALAGGKTALIVHVNLFPEDDEAEGTVSIRGHTTNRYNSVYKEI